MLDIPGNSEAAAELRKELAALRQRVEQLEVENKAKDDECKRMSAKCASLVQDDRVKVIRLVPPTQLFSITHAIRV